MTKLAAPERRNHRRRRFGAPMAVVVDGAKTPVSALNVSVGGAAVRTNARAEVGAHVALEGEIGGHGRVALEAEVVRVEQGVLGLRFLALGQRDLEALLGAPGPVANEDEAASMGVRALSPDGAHGSLRGA